MKHLRSEYMLFVLVLVITNWLTTYDGTFFNWRMNIGFGLFVLLYFLYNRLGKEAECAKKSEPKTLDEANKQILKDMENS